MDSSSRVGGFSKETEIAIIAEVISEMFIKPKNPILRGTPVNLLFAMGRKAVYEARYTKENYENESTVSLVKIIIEKEFLFYIDCCMAAEETVFEEQRKEMMIRNTIANNHEIDNVATMLAED
jgi:hypothetical protein